MPVRTSSAVWEGNLVQGNGTMTVGDGVFQGPYSFPSRFEEGDGTNPEELIGAAHAGCFSMALSHGLDQAGFTPVRVQTSADVHLERDPAGGFHVSKIELNVEADVPGIDDSTFQEQAAGAKEGCPISKLLKGGTEIVVNAKLV